MTEIKHERPNNPHGLATLDTSQLVIGTDGRMFLVDSGSGRLISLTDEQKNALVQHFGNASVNLACENVEALL